jgi:hypothetical protein
VRAPSWARKNSGEQPIASAASAGVRAEHVDHEMRWIRRGRKRFVPLLELERWAESNAEATL